MGDLVIMVDIFFVDEVISKGGLVFNLCGEFYIKEIIKVCLNICDFMDIMCVSGI